MSAASSLSVVIPAYNAAAYLAEALESVFAQTRLPDEILVVDDGSTDGTPQLLERLAATAPGTLRTLRMRANSGGPAKPINAGIAAASGEYISVLDHDDVFEPAALAERVAVLDALPQVSCVVSWCQAWQAADGILQAEQLRKLLLARGQQHAQAIRIPGPEALRLLVEHRSFMVGYPGFTFRRRDWQARGGVDSSLKIASDYDLMCSLAMRGDLAVIDRPGYRRREHANNASRQRLRMHAEIALVQLAALRRSRVLQGDPAIREGIRDRCLAMLYWLHRQRVYGLAVRLHGRMLRCPGMRSLAVTTAAKTLCHWAISTATRRPPGPTPYTLGHAAASGRHQAEVQGERIA